MRKGVILAVVGTLALAVAIEARAFGTVSGLGQNAEHERITREGLADYRLGPDTMDEIAGKRGSFGAVGAPDRPDRGLMSSSAAHCDNGDWLDTPGYPRTQAEARATLESCRAFILAAVEEAVADAGALVAASDDLAIDTVQASIAVPCRYNGRKGRAKCNVLEQLGMALHAAQDFYSHSNWVDPAPGRVSLESPPGLGEAEPAPWLAGGGEAAFPDGLISGCYEGFPESRYCKDRVRHASLNKDTPGKPRSAGGNHQRAFDAAVQDSAQRWAWFEIRLIEVYGMERGSRIDCVVRNDDPARCGT